ncbi:hypothetical protein DL764_006512 [Monosporascus ibericus]|uniref:2EXR domain-containing protein n=1 Tax=Monosporascus ibericus TaxID=155417 RepID=A0A4Q4T875_9PEZI|nr:hypothetical protein DL764_006512 [Monosporascus ibericus]
MSSFWDIIRQDSPPVPPFRERSFELFGRLPPEIRHMIWSKALDLQALVLWIHVPPSHGSDFPLGYSEHIIHRRRNGVLGATRESRELTRKVFEGGLHKVRVPSSAFDRRQLLLRAHDIFLVPSIHRDAIDAITAGFKPWVLRGASIMLELLVSIEELHESLKRLAALNLDEKAKTTQFWSVFPDIESRAYVYLILVDDYDENELSSRCWIEGRPSPLVKEVELEDVEAPDPLVEGERRGGGDWQADEVVGGEVDVAAEGLRAGVAQQAVRHGCEPVEDLHCGAQRHDVGDDGDHLLVPREQQGQMLAEAGEEREIEHGDREGGA